MSDISPLHQDNYREQLADAYVQRAGSFRTLLASALGFSTLFAFFIAWPYLSTVQREQQLAVDLSRIQIEVQQDLYSRFQQPSAEIQQLDRMIQSGPSMLRDYIQSINHDLPFHYPKTPGACLALTDPINTRTGELPFAPIGQSMPMQQMTAQMSQPAQPSSQAGQPQRSTADTCSQQDGNGELICRINRFVQYQLCQYEARFQSKILPALAVLQEKNQPLYDQTDLQQQFAEVREALRAHIAAKPDFWRSYRGKGQMGVKLQHEVKRLWQAISARMQPVMQDLDARIQAAISQQEALLAEQKQLQVLELELSQRLEKIQSPIGNLPIGLSESVLIFPIILAICFALVSTSLLEQSRLRLALLQAEQGMEKSSRVLCTAQLIKLAPLWLEPDKHWMQQLFSWTLLLLIPFIFLATIAAIYSGGNSNIILQYSAIDHWLYWLLYAISALIIGAYIGLIYRAVNKLKTYTTEET